MIEHHGIKASRRHLLAWIALGPALALAGCDSEPTPSTTATVFNKEEVHEAMKGVMDAVETLEGDVDDFRTTNWREVVPQVESGVADLRSAVDKLREELGYTE